MAKWLFIALIVLGAFLLLFEPSTGWQVHRFLSSPALQETTGHSLVLENTALKTELAKLRDLQNQLPRLRGEYLAAFIYSSYPFNLRKEILVSVGRNEGVIEGQAVVIPASTMSLSATDGDVIFFGKVEKVFEDTALVQTIFDSRFELAIRIGDSGVDALLIGGNKPKLTLIPRKSAVANGDAVYSAGVQAPYGVALGEVKDVRPSADNLFNEATLSFPYDTNVLHAVLILRNSSHDTQ